MVSNPHNIRPPFRLHGPARAIVLLVTALALALAIVLIWTGVAHPQADAVRLYGGPMIGGPAALRRVTAWLLIATCSLVFVTGVVLLPMGVRAGGGRPSAARLASASAAHRGRD